MRCTVGAKEKRRIAAGRGAAQGKPVFFAFGHRQAVIMRFDPSGEDVVAIDHQMMRGDRGSQVRPPFGGVFHALHRGDVLHNHAQTRCRPTDRIQHPFDEHRLAVEDVDLAVDHFAMHTKRTADLGHLFQHGAHLVEIGHTRGRVGRGACRIQLDRGDQPVGMRARKVVRVGRFRQV